MKLFARRNRITANRTRSGMREPIPQGRASDSPSKGLRAWSNAFSSRLSRSQADTKQVDEGIERSNAETVELGPRNRRSSSIPPRSDQTSESDSISRTGSRERTYNPSFQRRNGLREKSQTVRSASDDRPAEPASAKSLGLVLITSLVMIVVCGLLFLSQTSQLAATGRHISDLEDERQALLERRVRALMRHAEASNPIRLQERAEEMGYMRNDRVELVPASDEEALRFASQQSLEQPLVIARTASQGKHFEPKPADIPSLLKTFGAAEGASADESYENER